MDKDTITFEKLSWAAFIARIFGSTGPNAYMSIYKDIKFRELLAFNPAHVKPKEVCDKLIEGFLNKWRSRFPNNEKAASAILAALERVGPFIKATKALAIDSVDFNKYIDIDGNHFSVFEAIVMIFNKIANCHGNRTTAGAKILGIINPALFVMWDDTIAMRYSSGAQDIFNGIGYASFLKKMQNAAHVCQSDFKSRFGYDNIALFLSEKLEVMPPLTLAKFLDEYNWISISQGIHLPPKWHPCSEIAVKRKNNSDI
jgi:hypothetical protein